VGNPVLNAGAATWGDGETGVTGTAELGKSVVGMTSNTGLAPAIEDVVNGTFISRFLTEGGGHVGVGPLNFSPFRSSAVDSPGDQGGWLRMTLLRSVLDQANAVPPVTIYGVWRHVPGTTVAGAGGATRGFEVRSHVESMGTDRLRALPAGLDAWEA